MPQMRRTSSEKWVRFSRLLSKRPALSAAILLVCVLAAIDGQVWGYWLATCCLAFLLLCKLWKQVVVALVVAGCGGIFHWQGVREQEAGARVCEDEVWVSDAKACVTQVRGNSASGWVEHDGRRIAVELLGLEVSEIEAADQILVSGGFKLIAADRNPKRFDFQQWMWRRGLAGQFVVSDHESLPGLSWRGLLRRYGKRSATVLEKRLTHGLDMNDAGRSIILGVVLGKKSELGDEQVYAFQRSGALHVFAVSGMHVGIVALIGWAILRWLGVDRHRLAWVLIGLMFAYAWVTGGAPSAVRAAVMGTAVLSGLVLRRRSGGMNRLALAVIALLWWDGHQLFTAGFQLSFVVMASILVIGPRIERSLPFRYPIDPWLPRPLWSEGDIRWHGLVTSARGMVIVTISAWLGSLVLSAIHFRLISPAGLLASIPMILGAFVVLSLGALSLVLGGVFPSIIAVNSKVAAAMAGLAFHMGSQPWAAIDVRSELSDEECWILDVDEGGAVIFGGESFTLLDTGDRRAGLYELLPALDCYRNRGGTVILSHGDGDHVGGALSLWENQQRWNFIVPNEKARSPALKELRSQLHDAGVSPDLTRTGMKIRTGGGSLTCLAEGSPDYALDRADDRCAVWMWQSHGWKVLFMNDAGIAREQALLEEFPDLKVDVLVLGRHVQDLSGTLTFVQSVAPRLIVATHQNFPAGEARSEWWLGEVERQGFYLMRLDQTGAVKLRLGDREISAKSMIGNYEFSFRAEQK